jgi:hypothetical protein
MSGQFILPGTARQTAAASRHLSRATEILPPANKNIRLPGPVKYSSLGRQAIKRLLVSGLCQPGEDAS